MELLERNVKSYQDIHLYTSKISLKPFQLLSKKNSGISPSMNLSQSFSLSLLDLHLTLKVDIINIHEKKISTSSPSLVLGNLSKFFLIQ